MTRRIVLDRQPDETRMKWGFWQAVADAQCGYPCQLFDTREAALRAPLPVAALHDVALVKTDDAAYFAGYLAGLAQADDMSLNAACSLRRAWASFGGAPIREAMPTNTQPKSWRP